MRPGSDRSTAILLACTVAVALSILHRGHFLSTDEIGVFLQTRSLATEGSLAIQKLPNSYKGRDGRIYSQYTIGQSLLALPLFQVARLLQPLLPLRVREAIAGPPTALFGMRYPIGFEMFAVGLYAPIATGALAGLFFLFERRLGASARAALLASGLLALCTHAGTLSSIFLQHTTETIWLLAAFYGWHRFRSDGDRGALLLGSSFAATRCRRSAATCSSRSGNGGGATTRSRGGTWRCASRCRACSRSWSTPPSTRSSGAARSSRRCSPSAA